MTRVRAALGALIAALVIQPLSLPAEEAQRIGPVNAAGVSDSVKQSLDEQGYRVVLNNGWTAEFWFVKQLRTVKQEVPGAVYPRLANGEFVGVANLEKGMTDYRGQAIAAGVYTLRYQIMPQDANHLGAAPNPDFLLAIPAATDTNPEKHYLYKKLVALSAQSTGTNHPAVIALDVAEAPGKIEKHAENSTTVFTIALHAEGDVLEMLGIVLTGTAEERSDR